MLTAGAATVALSGSMGLVGIAGQVAVATASSASTCAGGTSSVVGDSFLSPNGPWDAWTWKTSGKVVQQNGTGVMTTVANGKNADAAKAELTRVADGFNEDVKLSYQWASNAPGAYLNVFPQGKAWLNEYRPQSQGIQLASNSSTISVMNHTDSTTAPAVKTVGTIANGQAVTTAKQWLHVKMDGSTIQVHTWRDGTGEPTTWTTVDLQAGQNGLLSPAPGHLFIATDSGLTASGTNSVTLDNIDVVSPTPVDCPVPVPPPLFTDNFTGADGTRWNPNWATEISHGQVTNQSGGGRLATDGTPGAYATAQLSSAPRNSNSGVKFSYQWASNAKSAYLNVTLGSDQWQNSWRPTNGYSLQVASNAPGAKLLKSVNGVMSVMGLADGNKDFHDPFNQTLDTRPPTTTKWWARLQMTQGRRIAIRIWKDGEVEPTSWEWYNDDERHGLPSGDQTQLWVSLNTGSDNVGPKAVTIDDVSVYTTDGLPGPDSTPDRP